MYCTEYTVKPNDTFQSIANKYCTTVFELARINNLGDTVPVKPQTKTVIVPIIANGDQDVTTYWFGMSEHIGISKNALVRDSLALKLKNSDMGNYSQKLVPSTEVFNYSKRYSVVNSPIPNVDCWIDITSGNFYRRVNMPCYPEQPSDSTEVSYTPITTLGRSEPIQIYTGTGPRTGSYTFKMHREMLGNESKIDTIVNTLYAAIYPSYNSQIAATKLTVHIGASIQITGIMTSPSLVFSGPIIDNKYAVIELKFGVTEVTQTSPSISGMANKGAYR